MKLSFLAIILLLQVSASEAKGKRKCAKYDFNEKICLQQGCQMCADSCIPKKANCLPSVLKCEMRKDEDTCEGSNDPAYLNFRNPNKDCFWCDAVYTTMDTKMNAPMGQCKKGACCEPIEDASLCNMLKGCHWKHDEAANAGKCFSEGNMLP
eukprot:CAMPEP_0198142352 /NCGR_PEP_ID=MMETSP1443-20131203/5162_1 /TAXON_ID=186043 /ORGANISM="Entomoneis sp., Strain CCMP2396" /LENGTH=151 /DNA_ID=CAMNT_0043805333 /DNA_START=31 /DNA_END=486 /DNA_ORIENTATION=+